MRRDITLKGGAVQSMTARSCWLAVMSAFSTSSGVPAPAKMKPRYWSPSGRGRTWRDGDGHAGYPGYRFDASAALDRVKVLLISAGA